MKKLLVAGESGEEKIIEVNNDTTLMEALRDNGFEEILALCGGCCSCSTCHVYIDEAYYDKLPSMNDDERGLLEFSENIVEGSSRLSCQINMSDVSETLRIKIAPEA